MSRNSQRKRLRDVRRYGESLMTTKEPSPPTSRAFVVQLRVQPKGTPPRYEGRIEPLVSGRNMHLSSWTALRCFVAQLLTSVVEKPP